MYMSTVGLRELRQDASDLIRRVEAGEEITVTVAGRPAARLVAARTPNYWHNWDEVAEVFARPADAEWESDRAKLDEIVDDTPRDPWDAR